MRYEPTKADKIVKGILYGICGFTASIAFLIAVIIFWGQHAWPETTAPLVMQKIGHPIFLTLLILSTGMSSVAAFYEYSRWVRKLGVILLSILLLPITIYSIMEKLQEKIKT